jgi:hypothetical protein
MNEKLAELYGTNETVSDGDQEKLAAAELAAGLAEEGGLDLDSLSPEQLEALADEVLNNGAEKTAGDESAEEEAEEQAEETTEADPTEEEESAEETEEAEETVEAADDDSKEKVAEADYLGRVMAHAYVQELKEIEKTAGLSDSAKGAGMAAAFTAGKVIGKAKKGYKAAADAAKKGAEHAKKGAGKVGEHMKSHKKKYIGGAAAAAAAGGGAAAYKHHKNKHASGTPALDTLVDARVSEILAANGITEEAEQEKVAESEVDPATALALAVEERALTRLQEMGYEFEAETSEE